MSGRRVRLISTTDEFTRLRPGAEGTVRRIDEMVVHVTWDDGSSLSLIYGLDEWEYLPVDVAT